jgi:RNA polymerase sigma-70 factor, ECF subfamily
LIPHAVPAGVSYGQFRDKVMQESAHMAPRSPEVALAQYRPQVRRHILAMVRDPAEAEDLTQDTYARAVERIDQLRDPQAALAWLYRIATRVTLDRLRRQRPATVPLDDTSTMAADGARVSACNRPASLIETALERSEMSECVQRYLVTLSDDYRVALFLHDMHGLSNPEVARLLGCSVATAKIRVHRARQRLRAALDAACTFEVDERGVLVCQPDP